MRFARERVVLFGAFAVLMWAAVMAVRQFSLNQSRHAEVREAFILAHLKGYSADERRLYYRLKVDLTKEPTRHLIDDLEHTTAITPTNQSPSSNMLVSYHLFLKREVEKRIELEHLRPRTRANAR